MPLCALDHPIHAPPTRGDPFKVKSKSPAGCILQFQEGVMCVYPNEVSLVDNKPFDWPRPNVEDFVKDQNMMFAMISDGPL